MTTTNDLIDHLVADLRPIPRHARSRRFGVGLIIGVGASAALMLTLLGPRQDLLAAFATGAYWLKAGYALLLACAGFWAVTRLSRPDGDGVAPGMAATALVATFAFLALSKFAATPADLRPEVLMGRSALVCPWFIVVLAAPILAGLFWAMRGSAPTHLRAAGLVAGLTAGALGAWVYAFHCPESGIPFIAIWYTAGIAMSGLAGLLAGSRLLRW